jgi:hypothetical protein
MAGWCAGRRGRWWSGRVGRRDRDLGFIAAYPVWSVVVIAVDVVVIYALCAHGSEGQGCGYVSSALSALRQLMSSGPTPRRGGAGVAVRRDVPRHLSAHTDPRNG